VISLAPCLSLSLALRAPPLSSSLSPSDTLWYILLCALSIICTLRPHPPPSLPSLYLGL